MVSIAVITLLGHAGTWLQNHSSSKIVSEIKTDVNSKSDRATAMIQSQNEEIRALMQKISVLEERLSPRPPTPTHVLTEEQFKRLLDRK